MGSTLKLSAFKTLDILTTRVIPLNQKYSKEVAC